MPFTQGAGFLRKVCSTCPHQCGYQEPWPLEHAHLQNYAMSPDERSLACSRCPQHLYSYNQSVALLELHLPTSGRLAFMLRRD